MKCLIVIDYQVDFVNGALGFPGAEKLESRIASLVKEYKSRGDEVLFTKDTHYGNYMATEEGKNLPVPHCIKGEKGHDFYGEIKELAIDCKVFEKETFPSSELLYYLAGKDYEEIALCGLDTSICVISNAVIAKAACPNAHIVVYRDASGSGDKEAEEVAIKAMQRFQVEVCP